MPSNCPLKEGVAVMKRIVLLLLASILFLAFAADIGLATKIVYRSPRELADESSHIVRGRVERVRSFWNREQTKIFTEAVIAVDETYKGAALHEARVLQLGGIVGHVNMRVEGSLAWRLDEEVLLFLEPGMQGTFNVAGFSQGKYEIERDPRTNRAFVRSPGLPDTELVGKPNGAAPRRIGLGDFIDEVVGQR